MGNSPTTGTEFYSGDWLDVAAVIKVLNIGDPVSDIGQETVERYQEMADRDIDGILSEVYHVPLLPKNQVQPDGTTKQQFPGDLIRGARYWAAALLLSNEFQGLEPNANEAATSYMEDARRVLFQMTKPTSFLRGQERRSNISRTLPPTMQPPAPPEQV